MTHAFSLPAWWAFLHGAQTPTYALAWQALQGSGRLSPAQQGRRVRLFYGQLSRQALDRLREASGGRARGLLTLLESRADVVLARLGLVPTVAAARPWLRHGHVTVNGQPLRIPSQHLRPGDVLGWSQELAARGPGGQLSQGQEGAQRHGMLCAPRQRHGMLCAPRQRPSGVPAGSRELRALLHWVMKAMYRRRFLKRLRNPFGGRALAYYLTQPHRRPSGGVCPSSQALGRVLEALMVTLARGGGMPGAFAPMARYGGISGVPRKPLHVEVSFGARRGILLFPPQGVLYPFPMDVEGVVQAPF
jgi:hypothetical protein